VRQHKRDLQRARANRKARQKDEVMCFSYTHSHNIHADKLATTASHVVSSGTPLGDDREINWGNLA
jgi:hypothetical protein